MEKTFENIIDYLETPLVFFDNKYIIKKYNKAAEKLICNKKSILDILNEVYLPIIKNGTKNRFPFNLSEKRLLGKSVLNTTVDSYRLIVKPIEENLFLAEFIKTSATKKTNTLLIKKNREFIKHSSILSELIKIKSGKNKIDNMSSDEIIKTYEEQLKLQFAIDDAVNKTIAPIILGDLHMADAAKLILSEIEKIINCKEGLIIAKQEKEYQIIEEFDNDVFEKMEDKNTFFESLNFIGIPSYYNDISTLPNYNDFSNTLSKLNNIMIIPLVAETVNYGFIILANSRKRFTEMHLKIATRLGQLFSLVIQRSRYLFRLQNHANIDMMTGCYNRRYGMSMLGRIYKEATQTEIPFSLMFFDMNNLKKVNDVLGHDSGDGLIKAFADIIKKIIRQNDIFFRYGGDEFILIIPDCKLEFTQKIIDRVENEIELFNKNSNTVFQLSVSIGCVEYNQDCNLTIEELISQADSIMYKNKERYKRGEKVHYEANTH